MVNSTLEQKVFLALLVVVSLAFGWILLPFYGAVFWAVILAIIFAPLQRYLYRRFSQRRNLTALFTLLVCLLVAVLPVILITGMLVQEGATLYKQIESGELDIGRLVSGLRELLPQSVQLQLQRFGFGDLDSMRERLASGASRAVSFSPPRRSASVKGRFSS